MAERLSSKTLSELVYGWAVFFSGKLHARDTNSKTAKQAKNRRKGDLVI